MPIGVHISTTWRIQMNHPCAEAMRLSNTLPTCFVIMVALWNRADHYIFMLWFVLLLFFSSPNLSRRKLDVCHTSTHGVALVRI